MKDEIKEILSLLNSSSWSNEAKQIEDYITNLQEENEIIHKDFNELSEKYFFTKTRCEKAVDEIQQLIDDVNNETIIGLNNFLPKLEEIQDKLANGGDEE